MKAIYDPILRAKRAEFDQTGGGNIPETQSDLSALLAQPHMVVPVPTGFPVTPPFSTYRFPGGVFGTSLTLAVIQPTYTPTYYVNPVTGNNANAGTSTAPFATVAAALTAINTGAVAANLRLAPGTYTEATGWGAVIPTVDIDVRSTGGQGAPAIIVNGLTPTWVKTGGQTNVYEYTKATGNPAFMAVDRANLDQYGNPVPLVNVASIALVDSTVNSYFVSGTTIYVHTFDNRAADTSVWVLCSGETSLGGNTNIYLQDLQFWGGDSAFHVSRSNVTTGKNFYNVRCFFGYSTTSNGHALRVQHEVGNLSLSWASVATQGYEDNFNYHKSQSGTQCGTNIEINCLSYLAGTLSGVTIDTNNCSTTHEGGTTIRVGGLYWGAWGRNVHDVTDTTGVITNVWNLGVYAGIARDVDGSAYDNSMAFAIGGTTTNTAPYRVNGWFDTCSSLGNCKVDWFVGEYCVLYENCIGDTDSEYKKGTILGIGGQARRSTSTRAMRTANRSGINFGGSNMRVASAIQDVDGTQRRPGTSDIAVVVTCTNFLDGGTGGTEKGVIGVGSNISNNNARPQTLVFFNDPTSGLAQWRLYGSSSANYIQVGYDVFSNYPQGAELTHVFIRSSTTVYWYINGELITPVQSTGGGAPPVWSALIGQNSGTTSYITTGIHQSTNTGFNGTIFRWGVWIGGAATLKAEAQSRLIQSGVPDKADQWGVMSKASDGTGTVSGCAYWADVVNADPLFNIIVGDKSSNAYWGTALTSTTVPVQIEKPNRTVYTEQYGVGTNYTLTNANAVVTFGTTNAAMVLQPGRYRVDATIQFVAGVGVLDKFSGELYNSTGAAVIGAAVTMNLAANADGVMTLSGVVDLAVVSTVTIRAFNVTAANGTVTSTKTHVSSMKL